MSRIIVITLASSFLFGCSERFQVYNTAATNLEIIDNTWIFENDTVKLTYTFWANKGVMSFSIYNKTNKPLYIDWKNSSFIHNSDKLNYWIDEELSQLTSYYGGYFYSGPLLKPGFAVQAGVQQSASKLIKPERITFIPPKSFYYRSQFYLVPDIPIALNKKTSEKKVLAGKSLKKRNVFYEKNFDYQSSPLKFRNFLTFSFSETSQNYFFADNEFYVKSINEMKRKIFRGKVIGSASEGVLRYQYPFKRETSFYVALFSY